MANNLKLANSAVNTEADALGTLLNGGKLWLYDGSQPATANTAVVTQTLLAQLAFANPAFGAATLGVITANAITQDSSADATGTATWFRCLTSASGAVIDGSVGTTGCDLNMNTAAIVIGAVVQVTSLTITVTK